MRMKFVLGAALGLALGLAGCTGGNEAKEKQPVPLSKNIEYNVSISNQEYNRYDIYTGAASWCNNNIEASARLAYLKMLLDKAEKGALKLTDMGGHPIDSSKIADFFYQYDSTTLNRTFPPYDPFDTIVRTKRITPENVLGLRFKENWTYDPVTLAVTKKIIAMAPIVMKIEWNEEEKREVASYPGTPAFWINFDEKSTPSHILTNRIVYNVAFTQAENDFVQNLDSVAVGKYFDQMFLLLSNDSLHCYTYKDTPFLYDSLIPDGGFKKIMKEGVFDFKKINVIRFMEEWTFDITTMAITKKVVGVCPVEKCYNPVTGEFRGYRPTVYVYFDDVWKPFSQKLIVKK